MSYDLVNASLELGGAFILSRNVIMTYREKGVKGVSLAHPSFFTFWAFFNLLFYSSLDQWFSFTGAVCLATVNLVWLLQIIYYQGLYAKWKSSAYQLFQNRQR